MLFNTLKDDVMKYFSRRGKYSLLIVLLMCTVLCARMAYLQIFKYEELTRLSENNRIRIIKVRADRGFIKDRNGFLLVKNEPGYELEVIKEDTKSLQHLLEKVADTLPIDQERIMLRAKNSYMYEPVKVARGLDFEQISYFMEHSADYSGLQFITDPIRSYYDGKIFSHLLGYLGEASEREVQNSEHYKSGDIIGKSGLERQYDITLRGKDGIRQVEVDSIGRIREVIHEDPPKPGNNIILTLDYRLQEYLSTLMEERSGSIVVLDAHDNAVLAMYSAPTYDLEMFTPFINEENWKMLLEDPKKPLLNKPIEGAYPPGSVFKILMAAAALKEGLVTPETTFYCSGSYKSTARTNIVHNCWKRSGHGSVNMKRALAESCDVYFYHLGALMGIDKIHEYATAYALGRLTGIDLPNEKTGVFPSREWKQATLKEPWYPGETTNISIGQGYVTTTPLQIAVMVASVFNGGKVYTPHVVKGVEDPVTGEIAEIIPEEGETMPLDARVVKIVMDGIVAAVEGPGGTSWRARVSGVHFGGKTGTAQVVSLRRTENMRDSDIPEHWRDHSWFTGIYPSEHPRYVVVVMLEHGGSGGRSSAPLAGAVVTKMVELGYVADS